MRSVRLDASRTTANASGSSSSSVAPSAQRFLSSSVLPRSSGSDSFAISGSSALICATAAEYCFSRRSLRLPNIRVGRLWRNSKILRSSWRTLALMSAGWREGKTPPRPAKTVDFIRKSGLLGPSRRCLVVRHQELRGVLRGAAIPHLEMQVRSRGAAGRADFAELAPALHHVAFLNVELRLVRAAGHEVVAVIDVDHVAVLRMEAGEHDYAGGGGGDRRATVGEKIDALVHRPLPCKRIHAPPIGRGVIRRLDRHHRRDHLFLHRLLEELRFEHAHHVVAALDVARERGKLVAEFGERQ